MKADVVIIGSGLGGLECGYLLSQKGLKVTVLESQIQPGGCMQSYRRGAVSLDTGLHYVGGLEPGGYLYDAFNELGLMQLPWKRMDVDGFDMVTIGGRTYPIAQGLDNFMKTMLQEFPNDRESLERYVQLMQCTDEVWMQQTSAWEYLNTIITNPILLQVLCAPSVSKMELRAESLPLFTYVHGNAAYINSSWRLDGDGNMLVDHLVDGIRANGGQVLTRQNVTELVEQDGRIIKAVCQDGTEYQAEWFVSNLHPNSTCSLVRTSTCIKKMYRTRMARQTNTFGMFTTSLVMKDGSQKYFNHNKFVFATDNVWDMYVRNSHDSVRGVMVSCREMAGPQNVQIDILTPMSWDAVSQWQDTTRMTRPQEYADLKERIAAESIAMAQSQIPGLQDSIDRVYTSSPLTWREYNQTPEGSAFGIRKDYRDPLQTIMSPRTPVSNLLMTGQSLMLHGLHGVTMTAKYTCTEILGLG